MRLILALVFLLIASSLAACASGPKIVGGGSETVSIEARPLDNVSRFADSYCQGYGKRAVAMGNMAVGPSTTKRIYAYNCVNPAAPHG